MACRAVGPLLAALALLLSACRVDVVVELDVVEDGSGTVSLEAVLDRDAVGQVGLVEDQVRRGGLAEAGWDLSFDDTSDGSARVIATKRVTSVEQWQPVLDEVVGPGVFTNVRVSSSAEGASRTRRLEMDVDLSRGWALFSDAEATAALGGEPLGAPIESLTDGRSIDDIIAVQIEASVAVDRDGPPSSSSFSLRFDDEDPRRVALAATTENSAAVLLRWIAIALALLCVLATALATTGTALQRRADRLRPPPTPTPLSSRVPAGETGTSASGAAAATAEQAPGDRSGETIRLVIVEPRSVLYQQTSPIDAFLLPFIRHLGGPVRADTIIEGYKSVIAGSMETTAFWHLCGVPGEGIDERYVALRELRAGARDFLAEMQRRRVPIAAASNDAATWSELARERDRLYALWPWIVSAQAGAAKPNFGLFEILRRESGVAYRHCLYVDTDLASLDAARELGMKTALFDTGDLGPTQAHAHPVVTSFKSLFGSSL